MRILNGLTIAFFLCLSVSCTYAEPTLQSIIDAIEANAEKRAALLKHSSGTCTVRLQYEAGKIARWRRSPFRWIISTLTRTTRRRSRGCNAVTFYASM